MEKTQFVNNRDRVINDFFDRCGYPELEKILDALIVFEAISNGETTKVFNDKAIDAQFLLITVAIASGRYRCGLSFS